MNLKAGHGEDLRQEVARVRELELEVRALLINGLLHEGFCLLGVIVGGLDGPGGDYF